MQYSKQTSFVIFSGGTACNHILDSFHKINKNSNDISYILSVSDNGGSSSEILRVLGGPSVGDLRSRLVRLMDTVDMNDTIEMKAIKRLLSYRLPSNMGEQEARKEWISIVEGHHNLWSAISTEKKEAIRGFFVLFNLEVSKLAHKRFNFCNGSIGNFFLTGARLFTGSVEAAIFLFSSIVGIPSDLTSVIPVISDNQTSTIAALLSNGETLVGQCEISHPSTTVQHKKPIPMNHHHHHHPTMNVFSSFINVSSNITVVEENMNCNLFFSKQRNEKLQSPIEHIYYINKFGQEIYPMPNSKVINRLLTKEALIYSIGSLYTSLIPSLILRGIGNAIAHSETLKHKILLLNGTNDRETSNFTAIDFIKAIVSALNKSQEIDASFACYYSCDEDEEDDDYDIPSSNDSVGSNFNSTLPSLSYSSERRYERFHDFETYTSPISSFITHLVYLDNCDIYVDITEIEQFGIKCITMKGKKSDSGESIYDQNELTRVIQSIVHNEGI
ncbi:uncharacterized protein BX663DRAFT_503542 [Cokeromyces recurvatus]|uniref:uncharacterized protein n=1 Tax=Cokeromyces recurvatus TaxID=90255 RepID=UPI00221F8C4D|nr:uncharacterized protein BX663DRAFT_503542 [Cokeromyces recurvatus]KAI7904790.1 hypothetical protein BX663DRAFT_503542 [Cokeromyces recurvatus]